MDSVNVLRLKSQKKSQKKRTIKNDSLKVVYISSPMKVKTSASRFRSLVQQLTGKNSDISEYMEGKHFDFHEIGCDDDGMLVLSKESDDHPTTALYSSSMDNLGVSPTSSHDSMGQMNISVFNSKVEDQFVGVFKESFFYNSPYDQFDVLGSYNDLI